LACGLVSGEDVSPKRLAAIAAAISAYLEAEEDGPAHRDGRAGRWPLRSPWTAGAGAVTGLGWAAAGRLENMLGRQQMMMTRRGTSPR
jgi:hypothetical protein